MKRVLLSLGLGAIASAGLLSTSVLQAQTADTYVSTLVSGLTPAQINYAGRAWRVNAGSTTTKNMDYAVRIGSAGKKVRFEIHNTDNDNSSSDPSGKRRAELSGSLPGNPTRLPNGKELWGAMSFKNQAWSDPTGMAKLQGGCYTQIHMGSTFGGSPAVGFRRSKTGNFLVTTRGEYDTGGTTRYNAALSWNEPHDIVYRLVLDPKAGSLTVWLDGKKIVDAANVSIGSHYAESYMNFGLYFAGGITTPVVGEFGNVAYPSTTSLSSRVTTRPAWPVG